MSLSKEDFKLACEAFYRLGSATHSPNFELKYSSSQHGETSLSIERYVRQPAQRSVKTLEYDTEVDDIDDERLQPPFSSQIEPLAGDDMARQPDLGTLKLQYHIHHSVSYQVPVLYIQQGPGHELQPLSIEQMHELLVPESSRTQLRHNSLLGMLTLADPPHGGPPALMLHPCQTQDVMQGLIGSTACDPLRYLILWLGFVGPILDLAIPTQVMQKLQIELDHPEVC